MDCSEIMRRIRNESFDEKRRAAKVKSRRIAAALLTTSFTCALWWGAVPAVDAGDATGNVNRPLILFETESQDEIDETDRTEVEKTAAPIRSQIAKRFSERVLEEEKTRQEELYDVADSKPSLVKESQLSKDGVDARDDVETRFQSVYKANEVEASEARATRTVQSNATKNASETDDDALFPNLRPFKRARARLLAMQNQAPDPPEIQSVRPEDAIVVSAAKPPVLTLENDSLPPFESEPAQYSNAATRSELEALRAETKDYMWRKGDLKITPYGFLNLAVSSDTQRAVPGEYILFLQDPAVDSSADFAVDARTSRIGLKIEGPRIESLNATLGGCAEFDFQGVVSGSKNKGGVQLRRAYAELVDAQHERRFLAGQDWEIISPGAPQMLNYLPGAFAGNIQYRRAQMRFEQGWTCSQDLHFLGQIGVFDDVLGDYTSTSGVTPLSAGWPVIEGRVAMSLFKEARCGLPITVGFSGHIGEQYFKFSPIAGSGMATTAERKEVKTWSANIDLDVPVTKQFKLLGEYYQGTNLSSFCGGINQGVDLYRRQSIDDQGWWASAHYDWTNKLAINVGYGIDKPKGSDLVGVTIEKDGMTTARTKNSIYFVNAIYNWTNHFMTGLEVSYWETGYQKANTASGDPDIVSRDTSRAVRTEFVTRLSF